MVRHADPSTYRYLQLHDQRERDARQRTGPAARTTRPTSYARKAVELIARQAARPAPVLPLGRVPRAAQRRAARRRTTRRTWRRRRRRRATGTASRTSRCRRRPSFNEADVSDKPAAIRNRALIGPARLSGDPRELPAAARVAARGRRGRSAQIVDAARTRSGARPTRYIIFTSDNGFFHGEHRVPAGKVLALRAVGPRPADHPRPRRPGRRSTARSSSRTSTSRRRSSTRRAPARAASWTAARCSRSRGQAPAVGPRHPARDADLRAIRTPHFYSPSTRPASRSSTTSRATAAASEPARGRSVHVREERPRCPARASSRMCRRRVSSRAESSPPGALSARAGRLCPLDRSASRGRVGRVEDLERELLPRPREDQARLEGAVHGVGFAARAPHADARAGTRRASRLAQHDARSRSASLLAVVRALAGLPENLSRTLTNL